MPRRFLLLALLIAAGSCARGVDVVADTTVVARARRAPAVNVGVTRLLARGGTLVATARAPSIDVRNALGAEPSLTLATDNPWGQRLRLLVIRHTIADGDIWLLIQLPIWPNGQAGWVPASEMRVAAVAERVVVDLSERRLVRLSRGEPVARLPVAVGSAATPTPPGRYFVWAKVDTERPSGPYGSYILGLSGFSDVIEPWAEFPGEPRLAIHGTDDPTDAGRAISMGCVRVSNALMRHLRDVPLGTPVLIRR